MKPLLEVSKLSKHYIVKTGVFSEKRVIEAVKDVSFYIGENESLGLIGESGSGKSTIANLVMRLIEPSDGRILLLGDDITTLDENDMRRLRKDIQIIFQYTEAVLDPQMTIDELIREPLIVHGIVKPKEIEKETVGLMKLVGLPSTERWKLPGQLSGGQNQRVVIARAIATKPRLIVCDEPVSALDVSVQGQILNLLQELRKKLGLSFLFISHDLKVVKHMCDRVAVMYKGELVEEGSMEKVLNFPEHEYTKSLIDSVI